MAVTNDPSQFAPLPAMAQTNAINRRLNLAQPAFSTPGVSAVSNPTNTLSGSAGGLSSPGARTNPSVPLSSNTPPANVTNPLSGGTGDTALDSYLAGDTTYQSQLSDLMRQLDQYNSQRNLQSSQTQADYDAKQRALNTQSDLDHQQMLDNFAARGILNSGIYANSLGQYNQQNQQQLTNLLGGLQNFKDNAQLAYDQFISNELSSKNSAIQQAAARRAAQLGQF